MNFFNRLLVKISNLIYPFKAFGVENIPNGKAVICSNHLRAIDVTFFPTIFKEDMYFLAKKELFEKKFTARLLSSYGAIPIDRDNLDFKAIINAIKVLKNDNKLVIFPEGTRNKTGTTNLLPFKAGSMVFATKAKCPIVPVIISNKAKVFKKTYILIGKPFELTEFYDKKMTDEVILQMEEVVFQVMKNMQNELPNIISQSKKKKSKNHGSNK